MNIVATFIANREASKLIQPRESSLHDPPMPAQRGAGVDAFARDPNSNAAITHRLAAARDVVGLVGMQRGRSPSSLTRGLFDRRHGVEERFEGDGIVPVGASQTTGERRAPPVDHKVVLRARFAAIRGVGPSLAAPLFAGMLALSRHARLQSIWSAAPSRSSRAWWRRSHTPAACQSRRRRQQVIPDPQPSSCGSISQGMPLRSTKTMPVKQARSASRGRPPLGLGDSGGKSGSIISQSSSETNGLLMRAGHARPIPWFC